MLYWSLFILLHLPFAGYYMVEGAQTDTLAGCELAAHAIWNSKMPGLVATQCHQMIIL